ncbi:MAG: response regulator [Alphaproteobacteria bacterium]|nr:response regulator [Alphaproteobacteria bacterium]
MNDEVYYHSFLNRDRLVHIVDPDPSTCEALSVLFRLEGFQTVFSLNSQGLFSSLPMRRPDIVVLNIDLDGGDGLSTLRRFKSMRTGTPVFMIANRSNVELAVAAMKAGANDVVPKPIDTERLVRAVREALRRDVHVGAV